MNRRFVPVFLVAFVFSSACGSGTSETTTGSGAESLDTGLATMSETGTDGGEVLDLPSGEGTATAEGGGCMSMAPTPDATLVGTVYAPNLEIPISGALVYLTRDFVEPIPFEVYCAECVELSCEVPYALTAPDGSFTLPAVSGAGQQLVVQKGQFLHVVPYDVQPDVNVVAATESNLPGQWNPAAGEWIPKIAVYDTDPDKVINVLAKFGLGEVNTAGNLIAGTNQFQLISDADEGAFMDDLANMSQYHIVFLPCAATKTWIGAPMIPTDRIQNIQDYVAAGGKWYATDHSNEYIEEPFSAYQEFHMPGMPDIQPAYTSTGTVIDPDLLAWLDALPPNLKDIGNGSRTLLDLPEVTTDLSYSGVDGVYPVIVQDDEGMDVNVGHHTWIEGPCESCTNPGMIRPMAMTGQYGCGRMMYSTFETSSLAHPGLNPQELLLLYMILEIGVCFEGTPPPPPID